MDLSMVVFDLRDAIEELREQHAELLKRIEALERADQRLPKSAEKPPRKDQHNDPKNYESDCEVNARKCVELSPKPSPKLCNSEKCQDHPNHEGIDGDEALDQLAEVVHSGILPRGGTR